MSKKENNFEDFNFINDDFKVTEGKDSNFDFDSVDPEKELEKIKGEEDVEEGEEPVKASKTKEPVKKAEEPEAEVEDDEPEPEETEETEEGTFKTIIKYLADEAIVDYSDEDEIDDSEEGLKEVISKTINKGVSSYKERLPEDAQKFLDFVENGGNPADFHKYYYTEASFENFDVAQEEDQKYIIREALRLEGYEESEIDDEITDAEDLGKLEKKAQIYLKKLQKIEKEQKQHLIEAQKQYATEQEAKKKEEWDNFKKGLFDSEEIAKFKLNSKIKNDLWDYMTKPIDKKTGTTAYYKDSQENEDARYMFAYLLKNKWDIKSLEKQVSSKEVSKLRGKLANYTEKGAKMKSHLKEKNIDNSNAGFSAFKEFLNQ